LPGAQIFLEVSFRLWDSAVRAADRAAWQGTARVGRDGGGGDHRFHRMGDMNEHNPGVTDRPDALLQDEAVPPAGLPGDVVEVPLLLSAGQMSALERAAHRHGLTAGEMVRRLLHDFIGGCAGPAQSASCKPAF
jgi:hypothetical protein